MRERGFTWFLTLGKRHHTPSLFLPFTKDNSSTHHTGSCENEVGGRDGSPLAECATGANAPEMSANIRVVISNRFFNCLFGFRDLIMELGQ